jgi:hypothetical protein
MSTVAFAATERAPVPLPAPSMDAEGELGSDLTTALLLVLLQSRTSQTNLARGDVEIAEARLQEALERLREAMERAREASDDAGLWGSIEAAFSGDVAALAGLVASAAAIVASGGTAAAVVALVAAGMSIGARVAEEAGLDPKVCQLIAVAGAVAGLAAGNPEMAASTATRVASGARAVQSASYATGGAAGMVAGHYRGLEVEANADGKRAAFARDDVSFDMEEAIRALERAIQELQRTRRSMSDVIGEEASTNLAVISQIGAM